MDNDRIRDAYARLHPAPSGGRRNAHWAIQERLFVELGYRDYLGALQVHHAECPDDDPLFSMSSYLLDYPFATERSTCSSG